MSRTNILLFLIGIMISSFSVASDDTITLTENNHIVFSGVVDDKSVAQTQMKLGLLSARLKPSDTIYLVLDTPGGSVPAGNLFIDFANSLSQKIKPICIFCASMGYHMFQSFDERLVYASSELMSHRVSIGGLAGQVPGEAVSRLNSIISTSQKMDEKVAARVGLSVEEYQKLTYDELWLDGETAVKTKHADRLAKVRCSNDLIQKTKTETVNTLFGPVDVTFSSCPLITGVLGFKFKGFVLKAPRSADEVRMEIKKVKRKIVMEY